MQDSPDVVAGADAKPQRLPNGKFARGVSGNPAGKRKHSVSWTAAIRRVATRRDAERLARAMIDAAIGGDMTAAKILFDRIDGRVSAEGVNVLNVIQTSNHDTKRDFDFDSYQSLAREVFGLPAPDRPEQPVHPALPDTEARDLPESD